MAVFVLVLLLAPLIWCYSLTRSTFYSFEAMLCRHPFLVAKTTISALIGGLLSYFFDADLVLAAKFVGGGIFVGCCLQLLEWMIGTFK
jgi:hypothetical protein